MKPSFSVTPSVSVVVMVRDGAAHLRQLEGFLRQFDEVVVGDDASRDDGAVFAAECGFKVVDVSEYDTFSVRRDALVRHASGEWVLMVDADERPRGDFVRELRLLTRSAPGIAAYEVTFRTYFGGRWLRHGGVYPLRVVRLYRRSMYRGFEGDVHERVSVLGTVARSKLEFDHYSYESTRHYLAKIQAYTDHEAQELHREARHTVLPPVGALLLALARVGMESKVADAGSLRDSAKRNLKNRFVVLAFLPLYPLARFVHIYFVRLGFLDGGVGLKYAALSMAYSVIKFSKYYELRANPNSHTGR